MRNAMTTRDQTTRQEKISVIGVFGGERQRVDFLDLAPASAYSRQSSMLQLLLNL